MEKYQIIPRKFRPKTFSEVVGHGPILSTIKHALIRERVGQAYLFCGARGCGKTTLARLFAKALNCLDRRDGYEPCNSCQNCLEITDSSSLDILEIDGASNRGIDDIRQINETALYAPSSSICKIYIIDEVHMLTKEAFNALLKTLEEPPRNVKFFFATTEPHKVPATIVSRCQRFNLGRIPEESIIAKLRHIAKTLEIEIDNEALGLIYHLSEGSLRDAESLLDQLFCYGTSPIDLLVAREVFGLISIELFHRLDEAIHSQDVSMALSLADEIYSSGKDLSAIIDSLLEHFRAYLLYHIRQPSSSSIAKRAKMYTKDECLKILDLLIDWQKQLKAMPVQQVHLEMLFTQLVRAKTATSLHELIHRLIELEKTISQSPKANTEQIEKPPAPAEVMELPPVATPPPVQESPSSKKKSPSSGQKIDSSKTKHPLNRYETVMRFAAVELEGGYKQKS